MPREMCPAQRVDRFKTAMRTSLDIIFFLLNLPCSYVRLQFSSHPEICQDERVCRTFRNCVVINGGH